ncbi:MAG: NAD(+) synthase [Treponema sp.]|nr:NAD(+) synthase [Treponema sp.]
MFDAAKSKDAVINWIRSYFKENGEDCFAVVGISGGKDSSIVAALCMQALGAQKVYGVLMPNGEQHDIEFSNKIAAHLGIKSIVINIKESVNAVLKAAKESGLILNNQAIVNIPARIRMTTLYAVSAAVNGRVANTCNLSEDYVGYSTKYGDAAGDFSPLSGFTVTEIKAIGKELSLPSIFVDKIPEDGLTGKSDEENLGFSYDVLDRYIREGICEDSAIKEKIDRLHNENLHKLKQMPRFLQ